MQRFSPLLKRRPVKENIEKSYNRHRVVQELLAPPAAKAAGGSEKFLGQFLTNSDIRWDIGGFLSMALKMKVGAGDDSFGNGLSVLHSNKSFEEKKTR